MQNRIWMINGVGTDLGLERSLAVPAPRGSTFLSPGLARHQAVPGSTSAGKVTENAAEPGLKQCPYD